MAIPKRYKKVFRWGGDPNDPNQQEATSSSFGSISQLGANTLGAVSSVYDASMGNKERHSTASMTIGSSLKGATMGAKLGSSLGPWGTAIGAGVGLVGGAVAGLIGGGAAQRRYRAEDRFSKYNADTLSQQEGNARIANDPSLIYGNRDAENFKFGGKVYADGGKLGKDSTANRPILPRGMLPYNDPYWKANPLMTEHTDGHIGPWGNPIVPQNNLPVNITQPLLSDKAAGFSNMYYPSNTVMTGKTPDTIHSNSGVYKKGGIIHKHNRPTNNGAFADYTGSQIYKFGGKTYKDMGGIIDPNDAKGDTEQVPGGSLVPMSSDSVQVQGDSHEAGGVQLPNAEVEGGESISNGFVFSKTLGFADLHKPIAKAIGKVEAKPLNPVRRRTLEILKDREQSLAVAQENYKKNLGIPSDIN